MVTQTWKIQCCASGCFLTSSSGQAVLQPQGMLLLLTSVATCSLCRGKHACPHRKPGRKSVATFLKTLWCSLSDGAWSARLVLSLFSYISFLLDVSCVPHPKSPVVSGAHGVSVQDVPHQPLKWKQSCVAAITALQSSSVRRHAEYINQKCSPCQKVQILSCPRYLAGFTGSFYWVVLLIYIFLMSALMTASLQMFSDLSVGCQYAWDWVYWPYAGTIHLQFPVILREKNNCILA